MKHLFKNWKTTFCGVATIFYAVKTIIVSGDITASWQTLIAGLGLIFAKDFNVTGNE